MLQFRIFKKCWQLFLYLHICVCQKAEKTTNNLPTTPMWVVTASEATLLTTMRKFPKLHNFEQQRKVQKNMDWNDTNLVEKNNSTNNHILSIDTECTRDSFNIVLKLNRPFRGLFYAKDFPIECCARGNNRMNITLRLPTSGCGIRAETLENGDLELTINVMFQKEQKLRQSSDIVRTLRCLLPTQAMLMNLDASNFLNRRTGRTRQKNGDSESSSSKKIIKKTIQDEAAVAVNKIENIENIFELTSTMKPIYSKETPRVRIWLELGGQNGNGIVEVGQLTTLVIHAIIPGKMGVRIVDCAALDGLGESSQQLIDDGGCPIDQQV